MSTIDIKDQAEEFAKWIESFPAQIDILSLQVHWSQSVEEMLLKTGSKALVHVENRT